VSSHADLGRLAQVCGPYLGKGQQVDIDSRLQTRQWDDDHGRRHRQVRPIAPDAAAPRSGTETPATEGGEWRASEYRADGATQ
jgi:single-stranded DNA-binding protein